jgi:osmotically-inducible protein OsmY/sporulation protein YlmC with PRC-barrel domain
MDSTPEEFVEVSKFRFGAPVEASDGASGTVAYVVVDPSARTASHVGVRLTRFSNKRYNVPLALVTTAVGDKIELSITRDEVPQKAQALAEGFVRLSGSTVIASDGKQLGRLAQLSIDKSTSALRRLVIDRGPGRGEVLAPATPIAELNDKHIRLRLSGEEVRSLPAFRPDSELQQEAEQALYNYPRLRIDLRGIQVRAVDGEIWLLGHISSDLNSRLAVDQLQGLAGLRSIHNRLVADPDLAAAIAAALADDPQTRGQHIGVYSTLGEVHLRGAVDSFSAYEAATKVASAVPGVKTLVNQLVIRPGADVVPVFAGITGQEDLVPGGA